MQEHIYSPTYLYTLNFHPLTERSLSWLGRAFEKRSLTFMKVIIALDAGTTNVKAILVDRQANVLARSSVPLTIDFPKSGWVEQSAQEVWEAARQTLEGCLAQGGEHEVVALGISNQRETLVA